MTTWIMFGITLGVYITWIVRSHYPCRFLDDVAREAADGMRNDESEGWPE